MICIFDKDATTFNTNGLATLEPVECLFKPAINGVWQLEMTLPYDAEGKSGLIANDMILKVKGIDCIAEQSSSYQLFRIYDYKKGDNNVAVIAFPIALDARFDTFKESLQLYNQSATGAVNAINTYLQSLTHHPYTVILGGAQYWSDDQKSAEYSRTNLISVLNGENGFVQVWGGDLIYDNYNIRLEHHAGTYTPVDVRYGKNMLGMNYDMDASNVVTCLYPKAKTGETLNAIEAYEVSPGYACVFASNAGDYPILHEYAVDAPFSLVQTANDGSIEYQKTMEVYDAIMQSTRFWLSHALLDDYEYNPPILETAELDWIVQNYALTMANDGVEGIVEHMWKQVVTGRLYSNSVKNLIYSAMKAGFDAVLTDTSSPWYIGSASKKMWADSFYSDPQKYYYSYNWDGAGTYRVIPGNGQSYAWVYASSKWQQLDGDGLTTGATDKTTWKWYKVKGKSWKRYGNKKKGRYLKGETWKINDVWYWFKADGEPVKGSALMAEWLPLFDSKAVVWEEGRSPETFYDVVNVYARAGEYDLFTLLYTQMTDYCTDLFNNDKLSYPTVNIDINFLDLSQTTEYKDYSFLEKIHLGDAVNVRNSKLGVPLITERIIGLTYDVLRKCNTEIKIGLTESSVVNLLDSIGKNKDGVKYVAGDGITIENGTISVTPPKTPYLEDVIVNGNSVVRNHKAYIDLDEMGIDETIDVLYGEDAPDDDDDGEDKDFYFTMEVETADVLEENDYTSTATASNPISPQNWTTTSRNEFSFDIYAKPNSRGEGEYISFNLHGLVVGHTYTVTFKLKFASGTQFPYSAYSDYLEICGTRINFEADTNEHTYTGTFTYIEDGVATFGFPHVRDNYYFTASIKGLTVAGDFSGDIQDLYNKHDGYWKKYTPMLSKLGDVQITNLADGDVPKWDSTAEKWINAAESGGGGGIDLILDAQVYSFEETQVGVWTDGKPLYQRSFNFNNRTISNKAWTNNICGTSSSGIKIVSYEGWFGYSYQGYSVPRYAKFDYYRSPDEYFTAVCNSSLNDLNVRPNFGSETMTLSDATIWYTKDSDTAGSGGYQAYGFSPIIYSEQEREVGVWIDNKPLYQKTVVRNATYQGNTTLTLSEIDNTMEIKNAFGIHAVETLGSVYAYNICSCKYIEFPVDIDATGATNKYQFNLSSMSIPHHIALVIQYTKTTDTAGSGSYNTLGVPNVHYTSDWHVVGTWWNGKPIYEKTFHYTTADLPTDRMTLEKLYDFDELVGIDGYFGYQLYSNDRRQFKLGETPAQLSNKAIYLLCEGNDQVNDIMDLNFAFNGLDRNKVVYISATVRYTKTTD